MKSRFPLLAAFGVVLVWTAMIVAVPLTMELFADFKMQMPALTTLLVGVVQLLGGLALVTFVLATALLLARRKTTGWLLAFALCLACDVAFVGLVLPFGVLSSNLGEGSLFPVMGAVILAGPSFSPGFWLAFVATVLNQILLAALVLKRPHFGR